MSFCKRTLTLLCAFAVMALGVFSFSLPSLALAAPTVDVQPFFLSMPQLPDGYFDGDILANGDNYQISLDFSNLASSYSSTSSESGTTTGNGMDRYTITVPAVSTDINGSGSWDMDGGYYYYSPIGDGSADIMPGSSQPYGSLNSGSLTADTPSYSVLVAQTADGNESYSGSSSESGSTDYSGTVSGFLTSSKDTSQHYRYRAFSAVCSSSNRVRYYWFVCDARNKIWVELNQRNYNQLDIFTNGGFPNYRFVFDVNGNFLEKSSFSVQGYLVYDNLGIWISDSFPSINDTDFKFTQAIFGQDTLLFSYLNTIHSDLNTIHSDIQSLQTSMQSAISNQTTTFQNMDAASGFDPTDVDNMLEYGSLESSFHAPSTDQLFSVSGGTYTDGMAFWRDRMNEVLYYSGSPILGLTTFVMTLGLAALVIGRRVSGGGSA